MEIRKSSSFVNPRDKKPQKLSPWTVWNWLKKPKHSFGSTFICSGFWVFRKPSLHIFKLSSTTWRWEISLKNIGEDAPAIVWLQLLTLQEDPHSAEGEGVINRQGSLVWSGETSRILQSRHYKTTSLLLLLSREKLLVPKDVGWRSSTPSHDSHSGCAAGQAALYPAQRRHAVRLPVQHQLKTPDHSFPECLCLLGQTCGDTCSGSKDARRWSVPSWS